MINFFQWLIFILFDAFVSTSATKLYPIRNKDVSKATTKSQMECFVTKDSAVVLDTPLRNELLPFLFSKANGHFKI